MFFPIDIIIFTHASVQEASTIRQILGWFEEMSRQKVNIDKSGISFSSRFDHRFRPPILSILGFVKVNMHEKYLGLPTIFDKSKKISFSFIGDRVWNKLQGWKEKLLTRANKEVLIKSVVQAIPTFAMSCFNLLVGLCKDVSRMVRRFWWGIPKDRKGICWKFGIICADLKGKEGLVFVISKCLTKLCWPNSFGDFTLGRTLC